MDLRQRRQLPLLSMQIVEQLTGLTARQVRYYEQQGLVSPTRNEGNQRRFSLADVDRLTAIRELLDNGWSFEEIRRKVMRDAKDRAKEPSDAEVYGWMKDDLLSPAGRKNSDFLGDLARLSKPRS
jgi:MerR family transcriptional regulator, glutamine synthetase repressor